MVVVQVVVVQDIRAMMVDSNPVQAVADTNLVQVVVVVLAFPWARNF